MNTLRACFVAVLAVSLLAPSVAVATSQAAGPEGVLPQRVLFIGNSHTARHGGLDQLIGEFVAAEPAPRSYAGDALTKGGVTLAYHWGNGAPDRIRTGEFDMVVLQGYLPGSEARTADSFLRHARLLSGVVADSGAQTVLFMTWPRGRGDWSTVDDVVEAHQQLSVELGLAVAPAALAFERARAERPEVALIDDDLVHATSEGAYLAAATVYAVLFERSPEGLSYTNGIDPEMAAFMQRVAWETVLEWEGAAEV